MRAPPPEQPGQRDVKVRMRAHAAGSRIEYKIARTCDRAIGGSLSLVGKLRFRASARPRICAKHDCNRAPMPTSRLMLMCGLR